MVKLLARCPISLAAKLDMENGKFYLSSQFGIMTNLTYYSNRHDEIVMIEGFINQAFFEGYKLGF
jgi:hypothetical protein